MNTTITADKQLNPDNFELSFATRFGHPVKYYDDGFGPLWIYRDAGGLIGIVRAQTWEDAWGIVEDEFLPVVPADEVYEAYGMFDKLCDHLKSKGHENTIELRRFASEWAPVYFQLTDLGEVELEEGYSYQSNATGTGIVYHDLNGELLDPLTVELCEQLELTIIVKM